MIYFWTILLVLFVISLIVKFFVKRNLIAKTKNDELFPRVQSMLSGKITRASINEVKTKLLSENIDQKRISRLISAAVYVKQPKYMWIVYLLLVIFVGSIIYREYNVPKVITPAGPTVYQNTEADYQINLPSGWQGITNPKSPGDVYFTNQSYLSNSFSGYPTAIEIQSSQTQKDISSSTIQQQILQSVYSGLQRQNSNAVFSTDFIVNPPYLDYTDVNKNLLPYHSRWYYFFGNGRVYAILATASQDSWDATLPQLDQVISSFKIGQ